MATHKSAEKRHRQSLKRRANNRFAKQTLRSAMKTAVASASTGEKSVAADSAKNAISLIDKAAIHGVLHKKNAARKISRLQKQLNAKKA